MNQLMIYLKIKCKLKVIIIIALICYSCSTTKNNSSLYFETVILNIKDYKSSYYLQALNKRNSDTICIVSLKENIYHMYNKRKSFKSDKLIKEIKIGDTIFFELESVILKTGGTMQELGVYLMVENDTLWSGPKYISNKFYHSKNSIGLNVKEK